MDLQARKLNLIREFLRINSEELVNKLDNFLHVEKSKIYEQELKPLSMEVFNAAIDQAEDDVANGRVTEAKELKKDIEGSDIWVSSVFDCRQNPVKMIQ